MREKIAAGEFGDKVVYLAEFIAKSERGIIK
jgi:UDP-N-acetylglucosamine acyltransferase